MKMTILDVMTVLVFSMITIPVGAIDVQSSDACNQTTPDVVNKIVDAFELQCPANETVVADNAAGCIDNTVAMSRPTTIGNVVAILSLFLTPHVIVFMLSHAGFKWLRRRMLH